MRQREAKYFWLLIGLSLLCLCLSLISLSVGAAPLKWAELGQAWPYPNTLSGIILWEIRFPRLLLSLMIGSILGLAGAALQGLLRNPLVEPSIIGAPQAAALGAVLSFHFGWTDLSPFLLPASAMLGAFCATGFIFMLAGATPHKFPASSLSPPLFTFLLSGLALGQFCAAGISLALNLSPNPFAMSEIIFWLMGSLENRSLLQVVQLFPFWLIAFLLFLPLGKHYRLLTLGEASALTLGVPLHQVKWLTLFACSMGLGAAVAVSGAIGFVGLISPHLMRFLVAYDPQRLLMPSALTGAALLTSADIFVRLIPSTSELKLGAILACLGVPLFLWMIFRHYFSEKSGRSPKISAFS